MYSKDCLGSALKRSQVLSTCERFFIYSLVLFANQTAYASSPTQLKLPIELKSPACQ